MEINLTKLSHIKFKELGRDDCSVVAVYQYEDQSWVL